MTKLSQTCEDFFKYQKKLETLHSQVLISIKNTLIGDLYEIIRFDSILNRTE